MQSLFSSAQLLSLILFVTLSHLGVAAIFAYVWHTQRRTNALLYWAASELAIAAAFGCLLLRPFQTGLSLWNIVLTQLLVLVSPLLYERGLRSFFSQEADRAGWLFPAITLAGWLLLVLLTLQWPLAEMQIRVSTLSALLSLQIILLIWQLWRYQRLAPAYGVLRFAILLLGLQLGLQLIRISKPLLLPASATTAFADPLLGLVIMLSLLFTIARSYLLLALIHTRQQLALLAHQRMLERQANQDELTGLSSRYYFQQQLAMRVGSAAAPCQLLLIDLDNFKQINDSHGHPAGDAMLTAVGKAIQVHLPPQALAGRLGGDEIAILVQDTPAQMASRCLTLQQAITAATRPLAGGPITLSIGLTRLDDQEPFESAYQRADQALYAAKAAGRRRAYTQEHHHSEPSPLLQLVSDHGG